MDKLKIRIVCNEERRKEIMQKIKEGDFLICDDADFILTESGTFLLTILARNQSGEKVVIETDNIEYFESFGHDVFLITKEKERLKIVEKMYELEAMLPPIFIRIGQSTIIHKKRIRKIIPSLFQRFDLIMESGARLTVTRGYYYRFREALGI